MNINGTEIDSDIIYGVAKMHAALRLAREALEECEIEKNEFDARCAWCDTEARYQNGVGYVIDAHAPSCKRELALEAIRGVSQ